MTHTVPNQTLFGGCGPSMVLGTWALPEPTLGTTGSQLLLGRGPSRRRESRTRPIHLRWVQLGLSHKESGRPEEGWGGRLLVGGWPGKPSLLTLASPASQQYTLPSQVRCGCQGRGLLHVIAGVSTHPFISMLKRQLCTKVSRKGILSFTRSEGKVALGSLTGPQEGSVSARSAPGS